MSMRSFSATLLVALTVLLFGCDQGGKTVVKQKKVGAAANATAHDDCASQNSQNPSTQPQASQHALTDSGHTEDGHDAGHPSDEHETGEDHPGDTTTPAGDDHAESDHPTGEHTEGTDHPHEDGKTDDHAHDGDCIKKN